MDTSGRPDYAATRDFYAACGYRTAATLPDFYALGDAKVMASIAGQTFPTFEVPVLANTGTLVTTHTIE